MIGIFDSGIGGLTVVRAIEKELPWMPVIYFGDTARTPYGSKSAAVIREYSLQNAEFLIKHGAQCIVIGCNSASSVATETLRKQLDIPVYEVIGPAAAKAVQITQNGKIGVIGTRATVRSQVYETTIATHSSNAKVLSIPCPLLVPLVEECWISKQETKMILRRYLHPLKEEQVDTLILGCTHYPLLKELISARMGRRVSLIDSSIEIAKTLAQDFATHPMHDTRTKGSQTFFFSDITEAVRSMASSIFNRNVIIQTP